VHLLLTDQPDGRVGILKHSPSPPGNPNSHLGNGGPGYNPYSPGYAYGGHHYIQGPASVPPPRRINLPLDEDDYLQPKSANPQAYLDLENNKGQTGILVNL